MASFPSEEQVTDFRLCLSNCVAMLTSLVVLRLSPSAAELKSLLAQSAAECRAEDSMVVTMSGGHMGDQIHQLEESFIQVMLFV